MSGLVQSMIQSETGIITVLLFAFLCGASIFYLSYYFLSPSIDILRRASEADAIGREAIRMAGSGHASGKLAAIREAIETYYRSLEDAKETSLRRRLVRAGFFAEWATTVYQIVRFGGAALALMAIITIVPLLAPGFRFAQIVPIAV